ncbi:preprotein translocase subunit YajC [Clostridium sp. DL1XJH146]
MAELSSLLPFIAMIAVFYLVLFLPERKRKKKYQTMVDSLKVGDEILTRGGIVGRISNLQEDFVIVESGPDKARFKLQKNGVASVVESKSIEE